MIKFKRANTPLWNRPFVCHIHSFEYVATGNKKDVYAYLKDRSYDKAVLYFNLLIVCSNKLSNYYNTIAISCNETIKQQVIKLLADDKI